MRNDGVDVEAGGPVARKREPAFNLPGSLVAILGLLTLIHVIRTYMLSVSADEFVLLHFAFIPGRDVVGQSDETARTVFVTEWYNALSELAPGASFGDAYWQQLMAVKTAVNGVIES